MQLLVFGIKTMKIGLLAAMFASLTATTCVYIFNNAWAKVMSKPIPVQTTKTVKILRDWKYRLSSKKSVVKNDWLDTQMEDMALVNMHSDYEHLPVADAPSVFDQLGLLPQQKSELVVPEVVRTNIRQGMADFPRPTDLEVLYHSSQNEKYDLSPPLPSLSSWEKTPCWLTGATFSCLPAYYVVGFSKCATHDVHQRLTSHPFIGTTTSRGPSIWSNITETKLSASAKHLGVLVNIHGKKCKNQYILGDRSRTLVTEKAYTIGDQMIPSASLIKRFTPRARFVVMLRDPAARAYSEYIHNGFDETQQAASQTYFKQNVEKLIRVYMDCIERMGLRKCVNDPRIRSMDVEMQLYQGMYAFFLAEWLGSFPKEQFFFLRTEDYAADIRGTTGKLFKFLGAQDLTDDLLDGIVDQPRVHTREDISHNIGPLWPSTRRLLADFYRPFNEALVELLGDPRYLEWSEYDDDKDSPVLDPKLPKTGMSESDFFGSLFQKSAKFKEKRIKRRLI